MVPRRQAGHQEDFGILKSIRATFFFSVLVCVVCCACCVLIFATTYGCCPWPGGVLCDRSTAVVHSLIYFKYAILLAVGCWYNPTAVFRTDPRFGDILLGIGANLSPKRECDSKSACITCTTRCGMYQVRAIPGRQQGSLSLFYWHCWY